MRFEQLEYLTAVIRHGSLRRAGEQLHVSQSALSEGISSLERELGVPLLERHRSGARVSREGRDLLPLVAEILAGVAQLKAAAGDQAQTGRTIRVGTVNAGTSKLLVPAVREFGAGHPGTTVDVATLLQAEIQDGLIEGRLDVGLINAFPGDDIPAGLHRTVLLHGVPAVCCRTDDPLAVQDEISVDDLRKRPFVAMRPGYLMHRLAQRLFGDTPPPETFSTDGAEMGKTLVASGTGPTILPDYSILGDPLETDIYFGGSSPAAGLVAAKHADVYLTWGEPPDAVARKIARIRGLAAEQGRKIRFGIRMHTITRDTAGEAWAEADRLLAGIDPETVEKVQKGLRLSESEGQKRMLALHNGSRDKLEIYPNLWAGVGLVRGGAGTALVGSHEQVAERIAEYAALGIEEFVLSAYPHLEGAYWFGEGVLPILAERGLWKDERPRRHRNARVPFATAGR